MCAYARMVARFLVQGCYNLFSPSRHPFHHRSWRSKASRSHGLEQYGSVFGQRAPFQLYTPSGIRVRLSRSNCQMWMHSWTAISGVGLSAMNRYACATVLMVRKSLSSLAERC